MLLKTLYQAAGSLLSPSGTKARLSILIYHRVLPAVDELFPNEVTSQRFDSQMSLLRQIFNPLPLTEAVTRLMAGTLPSRAACITFDDGYADNLTIALPILQRHGLHATFFIAPHYLNGGRMFNDTVIEAIRSSRDDTLDLSELGLGQHEIGSPQAKRTAIDKILPQVKYLPLDEREDKVMELARIASGQPLPNDLMMTTAQLKGLHAAGMEIGGHTARHPILAKLDDSNAQMEIANGKEFLESLLGEKIKLFAYPNGKPGLDYLPHQAAIVRKLGFDAAVSTQPGAATRTSDPFQLPRFTPWQPGASQFVPALLGNLRHPA